MTGRPDNISVSNSFPCLKVREMFIIKEREETR